ncbi:MAG: helix-turn-helix domain-containing protein, partial [Planctomycetota bacterium]
GPGLGSPPLQAPAPVGAAFTPPAAAFGPPAASADGAVRSLEELEREQILRTLGRFQGNRTRTAEALGIGVRTLGLKLKKWKEQQLVAAGV